MKKIFFLLIFGIINNTIYGQNFSSDSLINFIQYSMKGKISQIVFDNEKTLLSQFDSIAQNETLDYLYDYQNNEFLYSNITNVYKILDYFAYSQYQSIRCRATNLLLEIYRICKNGGGFHRKYRYSDFDDNAKEKILKIINNEPYTEKELFILHYQIEQDYKKTYRNDTFYIRKYLKTTKLNIDDLRDSLIKADTEECMNELDSKSTYKFELYKFGAGLYMYELIPNLEKLLAEDEIKTKEYKLCLARLGNKKYQKEIINQMYETNNFDYYALSFINTSKIFKIMIDGLKVNEHYFMKIYGQNKITKEYAYFDVDMGKIKMDNLQSLFFSDCLFPKPPFQYFIPDEETGMFKEIPESFCDDVAKWMEDNIDILQINPEFRY